MTRNPCGAFAKRPKAAASGGLAMKTHRPVAADTVFLHVFATNPLPAAELHCSHGKRPKPTASRGLAMKTHRSGGGECCVFATNPLLAAEFHGSHGNRCVSLLEF